MDPEADNNNKQPKQASEENIPQILNHQDASNSRSSESQPQEHQPHDNANQAPSLSKKQKKKLQRKAKWQEIKLLKRKEQRIRQKQKKKLKKIQEKEKQIMKEGEQEIQQAQKAQNKNTKKRKEEYKEKMLDGIKVVIDLQFYDMMTEKQQTSLGKQLAYCHSVNRKVEKPFNFIVSSFTAESKEMLCKKYSVDNYGICLREEHLLDIFPHQKIVYLTGDAEDELEQFDPSQIYIIGGIVDHNRLRNITINFSQLKGLKARRLPMSGLKLKASVHLAVNHVWQWMLLHHNGLTWREAIKSVIPERKLQECEKANLPT